MSKPLHILTLSEMIVALQSGQTTPSALTEHFIDRTTALDEHFNALITHSAGEAREAAKHTKISAECPLSGVPIIHKDVFTTKGVRTSAGSKMLDNFISPYDATLVARLKKAGMGMLGKANMDEFAMGGMNRFSFYGPCYNPWNTAHSPGGSSGGSAAAVAARMTPASSGTDTGGSVRLPASYCGITGFKPTYGLLSRYGMIAFASSLDTAGFLAVSAEDIAHLVDASMGHDPHDSTSARQTIPPTLKRLSVDSLKGLKIGLPKAVWESIADADSYSALQDTLKTYEKLGATLVEVDLPHLGLGVSTYYIIACAEASTNLSRFDGVRYGYRAHCDDLLDMYTRSRTEGFGEEVKRRILTGTFMLSHESYEAFYMQGLRVRRLIADELHAALSQVDLITMPTTHGVAERFDSVGSDVTKAYLKDLYTIPANMAGLPAISHPAGFVEGLPVGCQLIGKPFDDALVLSATHAFQSATDFHRAIPKDVL